MSFSSSVNSPAKRSITNEQKVSYAISKTSKEASCGISRLWVHANFRGKKIGTRLMEAVRGGMIYGFTIPKDQVAVTYLGDQGRKFFVKYFGTETYLVYIVNK